MTEGTNRWRLLLGRYADEPLGARLEPEEERIDRALDFLYNREYEGRGVVPQHERPAPREAGHGTLDASQLSVPRWLQEVRELFPRDTVELIERHALERYGLDELLTDPDTLSRLEPSLDLLKALLHFKDGMPPSLEEHVRRVVERVAAELREKLEQEVRRAFSGRLNRFRHSRLRVAQNLDWRGTVRRNLKHWDPERRRLLVEDVRFFARVERRLPWTVVLVVDQSASMADSIVYAAVMASILARLPAVDVKLVVFDTAIVDLTGYVDDPVQVLMNVQLGGGTNIGKAVAYAEQLISDPRRTVLVLVSDLEEGAPPRRLLATVERLREAEVKLLGLAALDDRALPSYDRKMGERLASRGMEIAALTPNRLAAWLAEQIR